MAKVFVSQRVFPEAIDQLVANDLDLVYRDDETPLSHAALCESVADADALICLITDRIDDTLMDAAPNLKVIANVAVGHDNIDVAAATERGILVTNTPDVLTETTADMAFALLLAAARRIPEADAFMRAGLFKQFKLYQDQIGVDVSGKTLGIVGMGRIGTAVARRGALGFGMDLVYTSRHAKPDVEQALGARRMALDHLLRESDFVSLHVPMTPDTHHLITLRELEQMKLSAILINVSRGPVVKEDDLAQALQARMIRGAGIDVFEREPQIDPTLKQLKEHVVVAPHIGSASVETRRKMSLMAVDNVIAVLGGQLAPNPVT